MKFIAGVLALLVLPLILAFVIVMMPARFWLGDPQPDRYP